MVRPAGAFRLLCNSDRQPLHSFSVFYLLIAGLFFIAPFGHTATAATYYVDAVNGNDTYPGTRTQPWQTMDKVEASAQTGDAVIILAVHVDTFGCKWPEGIIYQAPGVTQFGITWTFNQNYRIGRLANGDYWVVGPVTIIGIDPSSVSGARHMNGSMVNPMPARFSHGYDSAAGWGGYDPNLNVALDVSATNPLILQPDSSLVSTISNPTAGQRPQLKTAAILTVLESTPPVGSFRPHYSGTDKTIKFNSNQLNYSLLANLVPVSNTPSLATVERYFERPWLDHLEGSAADWNIHPSDNMPNYGRDLSAQIGIGALMLHLNFTEQEKETLLVRYVQLGIDLYSIAILDNKCWIPDGGIASGRKWPILFAGLMLDDANMKNIGSISGDYRGSGYVHFGEDGQTFYVSDNDIYPGPPYQLKADNSVYGSSVNVTKGNAIVTGMDTNWQTGSNRDYIGIANDNRAMAGFGGGYQIQSIDSPTQITLKSPYEGETASNVSAIIGRYIYYGHGTYAPTPGEGDYKEYTTEHKGMPEWGIHHIYGLDHDGLDWDSSYRIDCTANAWAGFVLAANIMQSAASAKTLWNHNALFGYTDRYMSIMKQLCPDTYPNWYRQVSTFVANMWDTYRAELGGVWTPFNPNDIYSNGYNPSNSDSTPPLPSTNLVSTTQTSSAISLSWTAPAQASDGDAASSYKILRNGSLIGLTTATSFQDTGLNAQTSYNYEVYSIDDAGNLSTSAASGTFSTLAKVNQPPSANAGVDQTVTDSDGNGSENVTLDGSASSDADGAIQSYVWREGGSQIATGANPTVTLSVGQHTITLTVTDNGGLTDTDTVTIAVNASGSTDNNPPSVTNCSPQRDSIQVPLNNLITLHIVDAGKGVDANSVTVKVNNNTVYSGNTANYTSATGNCRRTGTKSDYTFIYQPNEIFDFEQKITVTVNATDLGGNSMPEYTYSFWTEMRSFGKNKRVSLGLDNLGSAAPATVRDSSGNVWAVWHAGPAGSRDIYVNKLADEAASFTGSIQLIADPADQCNPAIALGTSDKLYVVWQDNRRGNWDVYLCSSADGVNWSAASRISDSNDSETNPAIAVGSAGGAGIVWQQDDQTGNPDIHIASSSDGFATKAISQITANASDQTDPAIAVNSANTVYVVWTDKRNGSNDIYGAASNSDPWTNVPIVNKAGNQSSPAIAAETAGSILHLLWVDDASGNSDIYHAATNGLPSTPVTGGSIMDDSSGRNQVEPAIAVTGSTGNNLEVFACWQDRRNVAGASGDTDLYFAEVSSDGGTNVFVGDDSTNSNQSQPAIGVDAQGHPYLVWGDSRSANAQIYYAGSTYLDSEALDSELVAASAGATVGVNPANIDSVDDVSVTVPAGACSCDIRITISEIKNPQEFTVPCLAAYDFGPSGIQFNRPVTITIPYAVPASQGSVTPYWFNSLTGALSQQGITDIKDIVISPTLHAVSFKTTHFTPVYVVEGTAGGTGGGGGGGGCSVSATGNGSIVEFLLPYVGLAAAMMILRLRDAHQRKERRLTKSES
jgi:chitodextrinase